MHLVHRTRYFGEVIHSNNNDSDTDFDAIWAQFSFRQGGCCPGFGQRVVPVYDDDLMNAHDGEWNLYLIESHYGHDQDHFFYKFVLIPKYTHGYGKRTCIQGYQWDFIGTVGSYSAIDDLTFLLKPYLEGERHSDDDIQFHHVHIGIMMDELQT